MQKAFAKFFGGLACSAVILTLSIVAVAQFRAGVQGTVTDSSGGLVSGATVTLTSNETQRSQTVTTSDEGFYRFSALAPGLYTLTAEQANFKKQVIENLDVAAENIQGVDIILTTGGITETVTVTDETTAALETENANVQKAISTEEIRKLPQVGRDPYELAKLAPGILAPGARGGNGNSVGFPNTTGPGGSNSSIVQSENQVPISASGQRLSQNNFQIDGISVTSLQFGGAANITPNQESVKEVQITSSSFSAEDGRNSGAQVKVVSQNGTNEFHGSAFFKYNDPDFNAFNRFYGNSARPARPQRVENRFKQFGGAFGGPLPFLNFGEGGPVTNSGKDRSFFFFSYEGVKNNTSNTYQAFVETAQYRQQVIAARPGGLTARVLSSPGAAPRVVGVIPRTCRDFFPSSISNTEVNNRCRNVAGGLDLGSLTGSLGTIVGNTGGGFDGVPDIQFAELASPQRTGGNQFNFRTDFNASDRDQLAFIAYITKRNDSLLSDRDARSRPDADLQNKPLTYSLTGTYIRNISSTVLNEFRLNFVQFKQNQIQDSSSTNFGIPRIEIEGDGFNENRIRFGAPRGDTTPAIFNQKTFEIRDTLTQVLGNHAIKYGAEFRREISDNDLSGNARPLFTFPGLFNFANDTAVFEEIDVDPRTGERADARRNFRNNIYGLFVQDDWKVRPNLTLNLGLRYEYYSPVKEGNNRLSALVLGEGARALLDARLQIVDSLTDPDRNNFAPRIGFAYSPKFAGFLEEKAVIRGGFGVFYNRTPNVLLTNTRLNPPFFARRSLCCFSGDGVQYYLGATNSPFSYPRNTAVVQGIDPASGSILGGNAEVWGTDRNLKNAEVYKYALEMQYELPYNIIAAVGYEGSQSRNLARLINLNFFYQPRFSSSATTGGFAPVFYVRSDVNANYNGMNARVERRFAQGFQISANYRFAKSLDQLSYEGPGFTTNQTYPLDQRQEKGPSDFDVRHSFVLAGIYELPFFRNNKEGLLYKLLGGFEINGIVTRHTGYPFTVFQGGALRTPSGEFFGPIRPTGYNGNQPISNSNENFLTPGGLFPGGGTQYFSGMIRTDPTGRPNFELNPPGVGRNSFRGPKYFNVDMSLAKRFGLPGFGVLGEGANLELRVNAFNIFNSLNLAPFNFFDGNLVFTNSNFGEATGGLAGRVVELQARFRF
ncbi:MAG: TonB-dependent receptor [Acidobacteriota bacterium]|nr:TonB-dependent receptor [Acidobacteriota bacterium]